jgi:hypothetical protein
VRGGLINAEAQRVKELEREVKELRRANEILKLASAFLPRRSSTADSNTEGLHRRGPWHFRGRANLQSLASRPIEVSAVGSAWRRAEPSLCPGQTLRDADARVRTGLEGQLAGLLCR